MSKESMICGDGGRGEIGEECTVTSGLTTSCGKGWSQVDGKISSTGSVGSVIV